MKIKEALNTKNKIHDKINSITDFNAIWEYNHETKACRLVIEGVCMEKDKKQSGLTEWDWQRIADLITTSIVAAIKPINQKLTNIENRLENVENRLVVVEQDIKVIKECPTIKKELK